MRCPYTLLRGALLAIAIAAGVAAQATITVEVIPALAPNGFGSPSFAAWQANALYAIENGLSSYGAPGPTQYNRQTTAVTHAQVIVTGYQSWMGSAPGPYAGELGNRMHFGVHVLGNRTQFSVSQLSFSATSVGDASGLDFSFPSYQYSAAYYGIDYVDGIKGNGNDIYITTGPDTQLVDELVGRGSGNSYPSYTSDPGATNQDKLNNIANDPETQWTVFTATWTVGAVSGSGSFAVVDDGWGVPVDLNGAYFGPNAGQAYAATDTALVPTKVIETSGGGSPTLGTFTPFSTAVKPPQSLQVNPFDRDMSARVSFTNWSSNDYYSIGMKSVAFPLSDASVIVDKPGGGLRMRLVSNVFTSAGHTDATGATRFIISISVDPTGIASARGETIDGAAPGTLFAIGTCPTALSPASDYAFFAGMETGGASQARAVVSDFITRAIPNALFMFADDPYVKNTEPAYYRLGMANLGAWMYGFQAFLQSSGAQTFSSSAYTGSPFASHFVSPTGVALDYAGDTGIGGSPVASNAHLATTTFSTGLDGTASLQFNPLHVPISRFGDGSLTGIAANAVNSNIVVIDTVAPATSSFVVTEGGPNLIGGPTAIQGTLNISANISDAASGLTAKPGFYLMKPVGSPVLLTSSPGNANNFTATYNLLPTDPCGVYKIRVVAADDAGNTSTTDSGTFSVNVATVNLTISLGTTDATSSFTRGVVIVIGGTSGGTSPVTISKDVVFDTAGNGNVILTANDGVPCDSAISRISVKDRKHTLRKNVALGAPTTNQYTVIVPMQSGDASDDNVIDIIDYGILASKFGQNLGANTLGTAPPTTGTVHPDFSGNGNVWTADYTYIQTQFLSIGDSEPGNYRPAPQPKKQATVKEMLRAGVTQAAEMDLNHDGWITYQEITHWLWR